MKARAQQLGDKNLIGQTVTRLRLQQQMTQKVLMSKMQAMGVDINYSSLSKLEGQTRTVTDKELFVLARIFEVPMEALIAFNEQS